MKKLKKRLCGVLTFMMLILAVSMAFPGAYGAKEVQAAAKVAAPKLVSAKPYGTNKIVLKWNQVKGVHGYRVYRKTNGGNWQGLRNLSGYQTTTYQDTAVTKGEQYTYTVRAYKKINGKVEWSGYDKKGLTTIAGLNYLKLNKTSMTLYVGNYDTLKINGTKLVPQWTSSDSKTAWVYRNGRVLAKKAGKATVTATLGGKKFNCTVTVKNVPVSNKLTRNYTKLKKYIQQNGEINDDGNYEVEQDFSNSAVLVAYNRKDDLIEATYIEFLDTTGENYRGITMSFNCQRTDIAQAVFAYIKGGKAYVTYSNLNPSRYTANTEYVFKYATNDKTANDFFQKQSNAVLKRTMGAFDVFLANVQMTAKDLGFTSYS